MTIGVSKFDPVTPVTADDSTTVPQATNQAVGITNGALSADNLGNSGATQNLVLYDATAFPLLGGWVTIGSEIISYTGRTSNTLTGITRGQQGTQIQAHGSRSVVAYNFTASHLNVLAQAIFNAQQAIINHVSEKVDTGSTSGGATITLTTAPRLGAKIKLFINGLFYTDGIDFTRSGSVLTFAAPPYPPAANAYTAIYYI